ncbi:hypothetical protein LJR225_004493 [Phenylobacterium sp. LjRoot225]|uniref:hypothetical protein n=1 Tax=Phenylobacterium sp. LjRoot225 TaxID=3342285 RepID=UPI003ECEEAA7
MSAPISIIAPMVPAAAAGAGKTVGGPLAGFDALMSAFFASADGVPQAGATPGQVATDPALAGQALAGQADPALADPGLAGQTLMDPALVGQTLANQMETSVPADASATLPIDAANAAGAPPTDRNAIVAAAVAPKPPAHADKILGGDAGKLVGKGDAAAAEPAQTPQTIPTADAAADMTVALDASVIVETQPDDATETPPPTDPLTAAQITSVMALMTPAPAPPPAAAKSAAPPAPNGSSAPPPAAEALPLPATSLPAQPEPAPQTAAEPRLEMLADKTADLPTPASTVADAATPKTETAKTASAPLAAVPAPAPPVDTAAAPVTAQAAAAPPPPAAACRREAGHGARRPRGSNA